VEVVLGTGHAEEVRKLVNHQANCRILADEVSVCVIMLEHSRQASAIDRATPPGLQAPGLMITRASRKRLPRGRFGSDMSDVSVKEQGCS
jgi:hypothetical protein